MFFMLNSVFVNRNHQPLIYGYNFSIFGGNVEYKPEVFVPPAARGSFCKNRPWTPQKLLKLKFVDTEFVVSN